jgi:hypothetical protein
LLAWPAGAAQIYEKTVKLVSTVSSSSAAAGGAPGIALGAGGGARELRLPRITPHDVIVTATPKRVYGNGHSYHINSIGVNCDGETFLSADDLHINLWHLHANDAAFKIVDIKPADMEELSEVITGTRRVARSSLLSNVFCPDYCFFLYFRTERNERQDRQPELAARPRRPLEHRRTPRLANPHAHPRRPSAVRRPSAQPPTSIRLRATPSPTRRQRARSDWPTCARARSATGSARSSTRRAAARARPSSAR